MLVEEHILQLYVAVGDSFGMDYLQSIQKLFEEEPGEMFLEWTRFSNVLKQFPSFGVLKDQILNSQSCIKGFLDHSVEVPAVHFQHVLMRQLHQTRQF